MMNDEDHCSGGTQTMKEASKIPPQQLNRAGSVQICPRLVLGAAD